MKKLWEELNNLSAKGQCSCICSCGGKDNMHKAEQDRRLIQFLMGLNEVYTIIKGSILMMSPLPSMAQAFALLIQEEKQREFKSNSSQMFTEASSSMNSSMVNNASSSGSSGGRSFRTNFSPNNNNANGRSRPFCDFCKKLGHIKDKCYKLHGYPQANNHGTGQNHNGYNNQNRNNNTQNQKPPFQYNQNYNHRCAKGKGIAANACGVDAEGSVDGPPINSLPDLTKEQYGQLLSLLHHFQLNSAGDSNNHDQLTSGAVNFAGPFTEEATGYW